MHTAHLNNFYIQMSLLDSLPAAELIQSQLTLSLQSKDWDEKQAEIKSDSDFLWHETMLCDDTTKELDRDRKHTRV